MPIAPDQRRSLYNTKAWKAQGARIRARAGGRCECRGDCGRDHNKAPPAETWELGTARWIEASMDVFERGPRCLERADRPGLGDGVKKGGRVGFGVAHLNHDSGAKVPDEQLIGMCSGCHLRFDVLQHIKAKFKNKMKRLEARGQERLV